MNPCPQCRKLVSDAQRAAGRERLRRRHYPAATVERIGDRCPPCVRRFIEQGQENTAAIVAQMRRRGGR